MMKRQMKALLMALPLSLLLSGCQAAGIEIPENGIILELGTELPSSVEAYISAEDYADIRVDTQTINIQKAGTYTATVYHKDKEVGNMQVTVCDTTAPEAVVQEHIRLEKGTVCLAAEQVASIKDFSKTEVWFLTDSIKEQDVPTTVPNLTYDNLTKNLCLTEDGNYQVTILISDIHGNYTLYPLNIEVYTPDMEAPVITANNLTVALGNTPDYLENVSAIDNMDGDLTDKIQVDISHVQPDKTGIYPVIYTVVDEAGNVATKGCTVTVVAAAKKEDTTKSKTQTTAKADTDAAVNSIPVTQKPEPTVTSEPEAPPRELETTPEPIPEITPAPVPTPEIASSPETTPETTPAPETIPEPTPAPTPVPTVPVTPVPTPEAGNSGTTTETQPVEPETPSVSETPEVTACFDATKADELLSLVNAEREASGIGTVAYKDSLTEKAKERAQSGNYNGSGVISCYGNGATSASIVIDNWKTDWPDGTWMTASWKYAGVACYIDGGSYTWVVVFGAY